MKVGNIQTGESFTIGEDGLTYTFDGNSLTFTLFEFDGYGYGSTMPVSEYIRGEPPFFTKFGISEVTFIGEIHAYTTYVVLNGGTVTGSAPFWDSDEGEEVYTTRNLLPEYNLFEFICVEYDGMALTGCTKIVDGQKILYILDWSKVKHSAIGM